jgi:hypothetical protein
MENGKAVGQTIVLIDNRDTIGHVISCQPSTEATSSDHDISEIAFNFLGKKCFARLDHSPLPQITDNFRQLSGIGYTTSAASSTKLASLEVA